jgi:hypothetical protein
LAVISAFLYGWAYTVELGYCSYFGIPAKVIDISITDLVRSGLASLFLLLMGAMLLDFMPKMGSHLERRQKIAVHLLAYGFLFGPLVIAEFGLVAIGLAPFAFYLLIILGGWTQDLHQVAMRRARLILRGKKEEPEKEITLPSITDKSLDDSGNIFLAVWMLFYAVAFGQAIAKEQERFLETPLAPDVVFVEKYGDLWIGKKIENGQWGGDTVLLKLADGQTTFNEVVRQNVYSSREFRWRVFPSHSEKK